MPPISMTESGLGSAVGAMQPALIVAPALPAPPPPPGDPAESQAARRPPMVGTDRPTSAAFWRKPRRDRRPAANSSMTCSGTGPLAAPDCVEPPVVNLHLGTSLGTLRICVRNSAHVTRSGFPARDGAHARSDELAASADLAVT